ncbi:multicopper oxidase family protein [Terriglobus sp. ADX1]|uniref:multicopper oxidase family protein n=1 Tax=Terriglobus sp. ADX1 TaxID=2794063 RepID=UPI002FE51E81
MTQPRRWNRREFMMATGAAVCLGALDSHAQETPDYTVTIDACTVEASPKHIVRTVGYNGQVPGPLLRLREGRASTIRMVNRTKSEEIVHWHGLHLPPAIDGAMEEGTPMVAPGATVQFQMTPQPAGFRWYHTHTFAGNDLRKAQYSGQHGFLYVESANEPGNYDAEHFLALHDWNGYLTGGDDGSMNPTYDISTVNGRMLGYGEPIRVKQGQRVLFHILNSSPTEVHWVALAGHTFHVIALDGNPVATPSSAAMLRLAPAERVSAWVEMDHPGVWVLGEVRKHIQASGMGAVIEYAGSSKKPAWLQPASLEWDYAQFGAADPDAAASSEVEEIPLVLESRFKGHGAQERWMINGKSYPDTDMPVLVQGRRYRLFFQNKSMDDHPMHLHRHTFELRELAGGKRTRGVMKDTVLVPAGAETAVEFTASNPGLSLLHCHQQNHMDMGFMMVFRYA